MDICYDIIMKNIHKDDVNDNKVVKKTLIFISENIAIFAILLRYFDNLRSRLCHAFDVLHLGIGEILHQCDTFLHMAELYW